MTLLTALALTLATPAHAGACDAIIKKAEKAPLSGLAAVFSEVVACDAEEAAKNFTRFMTRATDSDTLVDLSLAAIDGQVWNPVWVMPGKISDYAVRDVITGQVGASCGEHPEVVRFLQGAYGALRGLDYQQWDDAYLACESAELDAWIEAEVQRPPGSTYDEKYDLLLGIFVEKRGKESMPALQAAAVNAAERGPFESILLKMEESVAPSLGQALAPEDQAKLEEALVAIAQQVGPTQARAVAERLVAAGSESAAARLLPAVYPGRSQGGVFTWGGFSVERADCKGVKTAVLHVAEIQEPGKRWIVTDESLAPLRAVKPKLKKCTPEEGQWPVVTSVEPLEAGTLDQWARKQGAQWVTNGYQVTVQAEKTIVLN